MQKRCWQAQHTSQVSSLRSDHGLTAFVIRSFLEAATKAGLNVLETDPLKIKDFPQHRLSFKSKVKRFRCGSGKSFGTWISQLPETCLFSSVCSLKAQDLIKPWDWPLKKTHFYLVPWAQDMLELQQRTGDPSGFWMANKEPSPSIKLRIFNHWGCVHLLPSWTGEHL